jgi:L-ribulose-5-phosphate 4-epimerase
LLEDLREEVWELHMELPKNNLVTWTGGNISGRDPETGLRSNHRRHYEDLKPEHRWSWTGWQHREGTLSLIGHSHHLYIYRQRPDVGGVVHTHSPYATAFAALGKPIPVYLTAMADEFGGPIPCGGFALIGGEEIGKVVIESIGDSPAVLLKNHGVFTVGRARKAAVKAVMVRTWPERYGSRPLSQPDDPGRGCGQAAPPLHARLRPVAGPRVRDRGRAVPARPGLALREASR